MENIATDAQNRGEFWRPPLASHLGAKPSVEAASCGSCGTQFVIGSRFCHSCGAQHTTQPATHHFQWLRSLKTLRLQERLGLPWTSVIALSIGTLCTLAAIGTGLVYTADTVLDWQAVQIWRIEWLLAAVAAFLAGILLRSASPRKLE